MNSTEPPSRRPSIFKDPITFHAIALGTFLAASAAPTPLYRLYQEAFSVSPAIIALVFAVYALAFLKALLIVGSISDHLGRRPVIFAAIVVQMAAMVLFVIAKSAAVLIAARVVQGVATGVASASIGAALIDFDRTRGQMVNSIAPLTGMGIGAFVTSALVQFGPHPLHLTFAVLLVAFALQAIAIWFTPETVEGKQGVLASLRPRFSVPPQARRALALITPFNVANWILVGFYLSLVPSLIVVTTGSRAPLTGGSIVTAFMLAGVVTSYARRTKSPQLNLAVSAFAALLGMLLVVLGTNLASVPLLIVGTVVCGTGFGLNFLGCTGSLMPLAKPDERAELLSVFFIQSYLAYSLPAILAGFLIKWLGYASTADIYAVAVIVLNFIGFVGLRAEKARSLAIAG